MTDQSPSTIYRKNYTPPPYLIDSASLRFELGEDATTVGARLSVKAAAGTPPGAPFRLDGQDLELLSIRLDGAPLASERYSVDADSLIVVRPPSVFTLDIETRIYPQRNTALEGLYKSGTMFCTQCEAEGFRRITYFPDRPDVMTRFDTTIVADKRSYPVLLSNGNSVADGETGDGKYWIRWEDPFPKPCYLFALVAGDLACHEDHYDTLSGRRIALRIFVEHANSGKTEHAMRALKHAMRWDEETYGLEYDLDTYMIVAVGDFNMGAMENKGLNVFNTQYVLARPDTATDTDFENIEAVIGHEYFHNWTGNRVTCRDWFQLSLKEGLTVFREQQFSAAMGSAAVKRIGDVRVLRTHQFPEDAGPLAHPVRPDAYVEINNFYTSTVYNKGAEVIRMYHSLIGPEGFRRGMDLYFSRHDGQAVSCDDFLAAMADANGTDLSQFSRWYAQAGTPVLRVSDTYEPGSKRYTLKVRQDCPPTPGQPEKLPFHIPFRIGLLDSKGRDLPLRLTDEPAAPGTERVLELRATEQSFVFEEITEHPVPSLLRGFSAPVKLEYDYSDEALEFLFAHDTDSFNRWEAGQRLAIKNLLALVENANASISDGFLDGFRKTLANPDLDPALVAEALTLPSETYIADQMSVVDVEGIHRARETLLNRLGAALRDHWTRIAEEAPDSETTDSRSSAIARRKLRNLSLYYLMAAQPESALPRCVEQFRSARNMTDSLAALTLLASTENQVGDEALAEFHQRWRDDPLVLDKWFRVQATSKRPDTLDRVRSLTKHAAFDIRNPNKVRALVGAFTQGNPARFHETTGQGYAFLSEHVVRLNTINPQVAARLISPLTRWRRYDPARQHLMKKELERILAVEKLSKDVYEVAARSLAS